jgi:ketosteroid isomerase-like protein
MLSQVHMVRRTEERSIMTFSKDGLPGISRHSALFAGALLCLCALGVSADEKADTKAIKAVYETHSKAFRTKDMKALFSVMTPDYTLIDNGLPIGMAQLKAAYSQQAPRLQNIKEYHEDVSAVHIKGKQATVTIHTTFAGKVLDPQGGMHDMLQTGGSQDTLVKTSSGAWKVKRSEIQFLHVVMDGKPVHTTQ